MSGVSAGGWQRSRVRASVAVACVFVAAWACNRHDRDPAAGPQTLFGQVDSAHSNINFRNDLRPTEDLNIITYLYYYNGGGIAAGDVNGDGLVDLFFTANQGDNALYLNRGGLRFEEVTAASGIQNDGSWSTGASFTDFDHDGDLDLYVCKVSGVAGLAGRNELYVNDGTGHFTERAADYGLDFAGLSTQAAFFDADGDGDLDVYLLNHSVHATSQQRDTSARNLPDAQAGDRLFLQNERGTFDEATAGSGLYSSRLGYGLGLTVAGLGGSALPDIYVSNDFSEEDYFYENLGGGRFRKTDWLPSSSMFSMGSAAADLDADGSLDLLTLDMRPYSDSIRKSSAGGDDLPSMKGKLRSGFKLQFPKNAAFLNRGGTFVDAAVQLGIHSTDWSWAPAVLDADLDGQPDIVIGNGIVGRPNNLDYLKYSSGQAIQRQASNLELASLMPDGLMPNRAFRGRRGARFEEVSELWGLADVGSTTAVVAVDLDNDGDEDIVTNNINALARVYENRSVGPTAFERRPGVRINLHDTIGSPVVGTNIVVTQGAWSRAFAIQPVTGFQSSVIAPINVGLPNPTASFDLQLSYPDGSVERRIGLIGDQDVLAKAQLTTAESAFATESSVGARVDQYAAFDADPLNPIYPSRLRTGGEVREINAQLQLNANQTQQLWSAVDSLLLTAYRQLSDGSILIAGLWSPVLRVSVDGIADAPVQMDTVASSGLWVDIIAIEGLLDQYVLANVGLNTLIAEAPYQRVELHVADFDRNGEVDPILVRADSTGRTTLLGLDPLAGQMPTMRRFFSSYLPFSASRFDRLFPPVDQIGGRVYRAQELRNFVYDEQRGRAEPLAFELQVGTPVRVAYDRTSNKYKVSMASPPMRPELMAFNSARLSVKALR